MHSFLEGDVQRSPHAMNTIQNRSRPRRQHRLSFFLDNLLTKMAAVETLSKAWNAAANPEGKSVQPDVPRTISWLGRGAVILR